MPSYPSPIPHRMGKKLSTTNAADDNDDDADGIINDDDDDDDDAGENDDDLVRYWTRIRRHLPPYPISRL